MKERSILFSAPMVRAILEDRKTVTRRPVKVQPFDLSWSRRDHRFEYVSGRAENGDEIDGFHAYTTRAGGQWSAKCPYGQPGDRLWVRETFMDLLGTGVEHRPTIDSPIQRYCYSADVRPGSFADDTRKDYGLKWKPSIRMPRAASRILLEITSVTVERLQDITAEQALDEGIGDHRPTCDRPVEPDGYPACSCGSFGYVDAFADLWNSINGSSAWDSNPWVWVVEFKRVIP